MPSPRQWKVEHLDIAAFAREGAHVDGHSPLASFPRLCGSQAEDGRDNADAAVQWQIAGRQAELPATGRRLPTLSICAQARVVLECQRCLQPFPVDLEVERRIFFIDGEDAAAVLDADSDDDVLALAAAADVLEIVEDELLLALPLVPRHDVCPEPLLAGGSDESVSAAHPFAALAALRKGSVKKPH